MIFACEPRKPTEEKGNSLLLKRIIKGRIDASSEKGFILLYRIENEAEVLIDTVSLQPSGRFYVEFYTERAEVCVLNFFGKEKVDFVVAEEEIDLQVKDFETAATFTFKKSLENKAYRDFKELKKQVIAQKQRLSQQGKLTAFEKDIDQSVERFVEENQALFASLLSLELLSNSGHSAYISQQLEKHEKRFLKTEVWQLLHQKSKLLQQLATGGLAPSFSLQNAADSLIYLSDFKGYRLLLNFWASWCLQCPNTSAVIQEWQKIQFEQGDSLVIVHISLNADVKEWKEDALKNQKTKQVHLIAPQSWESQIAENYNIEGLPLLCLIDSLGIIEAYDISADSLLRSVQ